MSDCLSSYGKHCRETPVHSADWSILHFPTKAPESMEANAALSPEHLVISKNGKVLVFWAFAYGWTNSSKRN